MCVQALKSPWSAVAQELLGRECTSQKPEKRRRLLARTSSIASVDSLGLPKIRSELLHSDESDKDEDTSESDVNFDAMKVSTSDEEESDLMQKAKGRASTPMDPTRGYASKKIAEGAPKKKKTESITRRSCDVILS